MLQKTRHDSDREVQSTNEDAQISKLSCHQTGYLNDKFVQYFVKAPAKRSPLIHRGYFSRCYALGVLLQEFIETISEKEKTKNCQVISLGAGFDSCWFNLKSNGKQPSKFIELDFPEITSEKIRRIHGTSQLIELLHEAVSQESREELISSEYIILPVDLRRIEDLEEVLKKAEVDPKLPTYILSECVLVYLEPTHSVSLIKYFGESFKNSVFVVYEQINPNDAFGRQMVKNLEARGCPLRGLQATPTLSSHELRFTSTGWKRALSWDMDTIYRTFIPKEEHKRVSQLEIFDEFEEWHLIQRCVHFKALSGCGILAIDKLHSPPLSSKSRSYKSLYSENYLPCQKMKVDCVVRVSFPPTIRRSRDTIQSNASRRIGPLEVSPIGLGTWSWGNKFLWNYTPEMDPELQEVFNYALSKGVNLFDTADSYGTGQLNGRSESLLGKFIKDYQGTREIHIATKFAAYPWRVLPMNIVAACRGSLRRLDQDTLSLGQLHWSTANYAPLQELALQNGLASIYEKGLVKAVGVSNYGPKQLLSIYRRLERRGVPLSSAQIQFSLLSCGPEQLDLLQSCQELGISVIAYSPLALGLLTGKFTEESLPSSPRGSLFKSLLPRIQDVLMLVEEIAQRRKKTPAQVAINWCLGKGTIPIPGVKNLRQAKENIGAVGWKLASSEMQDLDFVAETTSGKMLQNIFQTK